MSLCEEALRLGRILAELEPREAEVHGLVALMEIQASRSRARIGPDGKPVLLMDQNRAKWDRLLIGRGLAALERAAQASAVRGPYRLQAEIAACHARAQTAAETDWRRIVSIYDELGGRHAIADCGIEPRRGGVDGERARGGTASTGPAAGRPIDEELPPAAQRSRRLSGANGAAC